MIARAVAPVRAHLGVVDAMLAVLMLAWSLNIIITRHMMTSGIQPLVYAALRYFLGGVLLCTATWVRERRFVNRPGGPVSLLVFACLLIAANQASFVYALKLTNASTVGLIFGAAPIVTALIAAAVKTERMTLRFAIAATVSLAGVAAIAVSSGAGGFSTDFKGVLVALFMLVTWSLYTVITAVLMQWWSASQIISIAFIVSGVILCVAAIPQFRAQDWHVSPELWALMALATVTLLTANNLYLLAMDRVGPSHMALYSNFFPFITVLLAVLLLSETLAPLDIVGGAMIAAAMVISWKSRQRATDARDEARRARSPAAGDGTALTNERS